MSYEIPASDPIDYEDYTYTADEIIWRATIEVNEVPIAYIAQLGFAWGMGGMLNLMVEHHDDGWRAKVQTHHTIIATRPRATAEEAQRVAIITAGQILIGLSKELAALTKNMERAQPKLSATAATSPPARLPARTRRTRRTDR